MNPTLDQLRKAGDSRFPGLVGIDVTDAEDGVVTARLALRPEHLAPNAYLHAGALVTLADTACGYGCILSLPEAAVGFTTIELKTNFVRTAREGVLTCEARRRHAGRTTQLWDATVTGPDGEVLALFRCTQLLLSANRSQPGEPPGSPEPPPPVR
jgi:1,4-dihydroxy-2-naphthoyl-CoA hydrolase